MSHVGGGHVAGNYLRVIYEHISGDSCNPVTRTRAANVSRIAASRFLMPFDAELILIDLIKSEVILAEGSSTFRIKE